MDKTIEQILVEVNFPDEKPFEDMYVGTTNAIAEAMKIAMKQAFETGYYFGNRYGYTDEELTFDEWFKGLEEKK